MIGADAADVEAHRGIEFERVAARGGLGIAEHDADLHADLVDENHKAARFRDRAGELAQRLAHQPRLQAGQDVAHLAFDSALGVSAATESIDDHVDRAGAHQRIGDFKRLLAGIGLGNDEFFQMSTPSFLA